MPEGDRHVSIMGGLLEGWDWFDTALQTLLVESGFRAFNKTQSMMIMYVSSGVRRPIEIARRMRLSRQAIRHVANQLIELNVLTARDDPDDGRSVILEMSDAARPLSTKARDTILALEETLRRRIGADSVGDLARILNENWGPVVTKWRETAKPRPVEAKRRKS